jgi:hypothetical protein
MYRKSQSIKLNQLSDDRQQRSEDRMTAIGIESHLLRFKRKKKEDMVRKSGDNSPSSSGG